MHASPRTGRGPRLCAGTTRARRSRARRRAPPAAAARRPARGGGNGVGGCGEAPHQASAAAPTRAAPLLSLERMMSCYTAQALLAAPKVAVSRPHQRVPRTAGLPRQGTDAAHQADEEALGADLEAAQHQRAAGAGLAVQVQPLPAVTQLPDVGDRLRQALWGRGSRPASHDGSGAGRRARTVRNDARQGGGGSGSGRHQAAAQEELQSPTCAAAERLPNTSTMFCSLRNSGPVSLAAGKGRRLGVGFCAALLRSLVRCSAAQSAAGAAAQPAMLT